MAFINNFANTYLFYIQELFFPILGGFLLSGILYEFIPTEIVEKYLGEKGIKPIIISSSIGTILPICCFGTLPIAVTMQQKGARLGPVLAFLVTTPATSVSALLACWKLLGVIFAIYIFFAVIIMGLIIGILGNMIQPSNPRMNNADDRDCCHNKQGQIKESHKELTLKIKGALTYAFVTLPKEIGLELLLGMAVASFVMVFQPAHVVIKEYLSGIFGYIFSLAVGLATYVCSTASVPMADAFVKSGMPYGPAMVYLLVGPITSYGTIFAVRKAFGTKVLGLYLAVISLLSVIFGIFFNIVVLGRVF